MEYISKFFAAFLGCFLGIFIFDYLTRKGKHPHESSSGKFYYFKCPICGETCSSYTLSFDNITEVDPYTFFFYPNKYCSNCGTKLNWKGIDTSKYKLIHDKERNILENISGQKEVKL